jgi:hypothetical protein
MLKNIFISNKPQAFFIWIILLLLAFLLNSLLTMKFPRLTNKQMKLTPSLRGIYIIYY